METSQKVINGIMIAFVLSLTYVNVVQDNQGKDLPATHSCEARGIKSYCTGFSKYYGLENGKCLNPKGNLLCRSGWEEIPKIDTAVVEYNFTIKSGKQETVWVCPKRPNDCYFRII